MTALPFVYDDGGRELAGFKGDAGDCVTRALAIAEWYRRGAEFHDDPGALYRAIYQDLHGETKRRGMSSPRNGVAKKLWQEFYASYGYVWTPTMRVGQGTTVHLRADELPSGIVIVKVSKHACAVIDGIVRDTHDPSRDGTRAVYGYWQRPS